MKELLFQADLEESIGYHDLAEMKRRQAEISGRYGEKTIRKEFMTLPVQ